MGEGRGGAAGPSKSSNQGALSACACGLVITCPKWRGESSSCHWHAEVPTHAYMCTHLYRLAHGFPRAVTGRCKERTVQIALKQVNLSLPTHYNPLKWTSLRKNKEIKRQSVAKSKSRICCCLLPAHNLGKPSPNRGRPCLAGTGLAREGHGRDDSHSSIPLASRARGAKAVQYTQSYNPKSTLLGLPSLPLLQKPSPFTQPGKKAPVLSGGFWQVPPLHTLHSPSRASHPQARSSSELEENYCWSHFTGDRLWPGEMPGQEREPEEKAKQNRARSKACWTPAQLLSVRGGGEKKQLYSERGCPCSAFLAPPASPGAPRPRIAYKGWAESGEGLLAGRLQPSWCTAFSCSWLYLEGIFLDAKHWFSPIQNGNIHEKGSFMINLWVLGRGEKKKRKCSPENNIAFIFRHCLLSPQGAPPWGMHLLQQPRQGLGAAQPLAVAFARRYRHRAGRPESKWKNGRDRVPISSLISLTY